MDHRPSAGQAGWVIKIYILINKGWVVEWQTPSLMRKTSAAVITFSEKRIPGSHVLSACVQAIVEIPKHLHLCDWVAAPRWPQKDSDLHFSDLGLVDDLIHMCSTRLSLVFSIKLSVIKSSPISQISNLDVLILWRCDSGFRCMNCPLKILQSSPWYDTSLKP